MHETSPSSPTPPPLILASTSRYRAELLGRLNLPFDTLAPAVDEAHLHEESPTDRASRLAREKSVALAAQFPDAVLIGSDQVASRRDEPSQLFDKPGTTENAVATLLSLRGRTINFHTAVCLYHGASDTRIEHLDVTAVEVRKDLSEAAVSRYVETDDPLQCAGAFKVESLGIALFTAVRSEDPTALVGLPLIAVAKALRTFGFETP